MLPIKKILVARDFSEYSENALSYAQALARRLDAELHLLFAEVLFGESIDTAVVALDDRFRERLGKLPAEGQDLDQDAVPATPVLVRGIAAASAILDYAREQEIDLIVLGTHGRRGVRHMLLGSVAEEVLRLAPCPVLTVGRVDPGRRLDDAAFSILVPMDFSPYAREALQYAKELAALFNARIDLLHVVDVHYHPTFFETGLFSIYDVEPDVEEKARIRLQQVYHETDGPEATAVQIEVCTGAAAHEIVQYARRNATSLIVMATHGMTGLSHFLIGSVAEKVVRTAPCPVFTVKSFSQNGHYAASAQASVQAVD